MGLFLSIHDNILALSLRYVRKLKDEIAVDSST